MSLLRKKVKQEKFIKYKGKEYTRRQLSDLLNIPYQTIINRLHAGYSIDEIIEQEEKTKNEYKSLDEIIQNVLSRPNPYTETTTDWLKGILK